MFDRYWNSPQAAPASIFHAGAGLHLFDKLLGRGLRKLERSPYREVFPLEPGDWYERLRTIEAAMIPATFEVLYDRPGVREPSQDTMFGLQRFFDQAEEEVLTINPYVVPGDAFAAGVKEVVDRGVRFALLTNSLGSTNQTIVNSAYAKRRRPMIEAGVELHELRHEGAIKADVDTPPVQSSFLALHAKAAVLDREHVFVGSYNFSPRSRDLNTEMGLLVHSPELGAQLADVLTRAMAPENAWRVTLDGDGRLRWSSSDVEVTSQPAQNFWRRIENGIFGLLPIEDHL
jgi:putative cardiolipin synthase